jgi:hypothetical protein
VERRTDRDGVVMTYQYGPDGRLVELSKAATATAEVVELQESPRNAA